VSLKTRLTSCIKVARENPFKNLTMVFKGLCTGAESTCTSQKLLCGKCDNQKWCERHCKCPENEHEKKYPTLLKTPNQPRMAKDRALKGILDDMKRNLFTPEALKATPAAERWKDPEVRTLKGLFQCFSSQGNFRNIPSDKIRFASNAEELIVKANRNVRNNTVNFLLEILERCARIILPTAFTYIMGVAATKIREKWNKTFTENSTKREKALEKMATSLFAIATSLLPKSIAVRTARAVIVSACSQKNLDDNFYEYGPPIYGEKARKNGRKDHLRMVTEGKPPLVIKRKLARVDDDIVLGMVHFILSPQNVGTLSWGKNEVLIPNTSTTVVLPKLT
jgi:hypothetical protein